MSRATSIVHAHLADMVIEEGNALTVPRGHKSVGLALAALMLGPALSVCQTITSLSPSSTSISSTGGVGVVGVTAQPNASWTAVSKTDWIRILGHSLVVDPVLRSGISGTGSGSFTYSVSSNLTQVARTGNITVGGQAFTVNQDAGSTPFPLTWVPIGPHHIPGSLGSLASGKLQALAVYYSDPNVIYAGGGLGSGNEGPLTEAGVFKTTDGGLTWTAKNNGLTDPIVDTLWVDQTDPNLVLAGTERTGIFRSTDGGQTWSLSVNLGATSVIISASGGLLAATAAGIAQSTDSGATWSIIQPTTSAVRALAVSGSGQSIAGLDDGTVMIRATATAPWQTAASNPGRTVWAVAWDPTNPRVVYAVVAYGSTPPALMVTRDTGVTWTAVALPGVPPPAGDGSSPPPQAIAAGSAPAAVYVASGNPGALFSTSDGGQSWATIPIPQIGTWDIRAVYPIPAQGNLILGSDQGLYKTADSGKTWNSISGSVSSSILTALAVSGSTILTAVQDFSPILSFDGGNTWLQPVWSSNRPPVGEVGGAAINPVNPNYCYAYTMAGYQYSTDACHTFQLSSVTELGFISYVQPGGTEIIAVARNNPSTIYAASQSGVFVSTDWGITMRRTSWPLTQTTAIAVDPVDSTIVYVGATSGLYKTNDGGTSWKKLNLAGLPGYPTTIAVNPKDSRTILVGLSQGPARGGGVLRSMDGGGTFTAVNAGISMAAENLVCCGVDILSLRFDLDPTPAEVALATSTGIYISTDLGDHWQNANGNAVPAYFSDVAWDSGYLYAATFGQGVLRAAMPGPVPTPAANGTVNAASLAPGAPVAPGSIASVFGANLGTTDGAATLPLPTTLGGATLLFNGKIPVPDIFSSPGQLNIQVPWELAGQTQASLTAFVDGITSNPTTVNLAPFAPGIFSMNSSGAGQGAVLITTTGELAAPAGLIPGFASRPARIGEYLSIYCTGLGDVTNRPPSGAAAPDGPLAATRSPATVTIAGANAPVIFSGLAPGFVGLYQVNAQVPAAAGTGNALALVLTIGGARSNTVTVAVQPGM